MTTEHKFRRGTSAEHTAFTGAVGEITVDTDKNVPVVHDNSQAGGFPVNKEISVEEFIKKYGKPYHPETDDYDVPPFQENIDNASKSSNKPPSKVMLVGTTSLIR